MICPCCGSKVAGDLKEEACASCGARAVGPPLARPAHELPSYGRALLICAAGALLLVIFLASTIAAWWEPLPAPAGFWKIVAAAETAAWRLKFWALPAAALALWASTRLRATIKRAPLRFAGLRAAHAGLLMTGVVLFATVTLIGVTVPERLRQREVARRAGENALTYAAHRILLEYRTRYGSLPATAQDLDKLTYEDAASIKARALLKESMYLPEASLASLPATPSKGRTRRVKAVRVSATSAKNSTDDTPGETLSLTNYTLVLPGRDKLLDTPDDIWIRDGLRIPAPPPAKRPFPSPSLMTGTTSAP